MNTPFSIDVRFEKIVHGGDAMGRAPDGRAVFVPFAAPQDLARVEILEEKKGYLRGRLVEVLEPSVNRVTPRCPLFGDCGGCHLQHMDYPAQWQAKREILREQLARLGNIADAPIAEGFPAPQPFHYRNHIQFSLAKDGKLGFNRNSSHRVVSVEECFLPLPQLELLRRSLDWEPVPGVRQISFRAGDDGEMIVLESDTGETPETMVEAEVSMAMLGPDGEAEYLAGGPLRYEILGRMFQVSAGSFFQVHTAMIPAMVNQVLAYANVQPGEIVLDLYCGTGLFTAFLAERAARTIGVELSKTAVEDFTTNLAEFNAVELYAASADQALPAIEGPIHVAVADPPREGLEEPALLELLRHSPSRIVLISCDAATLARDGGRLRVGGYVLQEITPFDLFPQTFHLETISLWKKEQALP
jgi:23S rRNA (uracil1939-C5)-methyltransferase